MAPLPVNDTFTEEKNKQENTPIMLYTIVFPGATNVTLAEWDVDVLYNGITYITFPLKHEGISKNILGETDTVKVVLSNVNREMAAILLSYGGLIDYQIDLMLVFANHLDDADANIMETYWVDNSSIAEGECVFILSTRLDLFQIKLPRRTMNRNRCGWIFKKEGCWLASGDTWAAPGGFIHSDISCDHTVSGPTGCNFHNNGPRCGAFPGIPHKSFFII